MQTDLNDYVFTNNDLRDKDGNPLSMHAIADQLERGCLSVNDLPNQWLGRYVRAMEEELGELKDRSLFRGAAEQTDP